MMDPEQAKMKADEIERDLGRIFQEHMTAENFADPNNFSGVCIGLSDFVATSIVSMAVTILANSGKPLDEAEELFTMVRNAIDRRIADLMKSARTAFPTLIDEVEKRKNVNATDEDRTFRAVTEGFKMKVDSLQVTVRNRSKMN
jgi:hypothetical protein